MFEYKVLEKKKILELFYEKQEERLVYRTSRARYIIDYVVKRDGTIIERDSINLWEYPKLNYEAIIDTFKRLEARAEDILNERAKNFVDLLNKLEKEGIEIKIKVEKDP